MNTTNDYTPRIEGDIKVTRCIEQWNSILVGNKIIDSLREIALNRNEKPTYKLGTKIHHTCFPDGSRLNYQFDCIC